MKRKRILAASVLAVFCLCSACASDQVNEPASLVTEDVGTQDQTDEELCVYVCGAVKKAGVYRLAAGSRVQDAIEAAGGFSKYADQTGLNLAALLEDEMQIVVETLQDETAVDSPKDKKVNLNSADKETLMTLPGVGEAKAESIIQYRKEHGRFKKKEDIMNVSGIKEGLFTKIKDLVTV